MKKCRLCLSENGNLTDVSEVREGLPLSVIAMIICPIKIESCDNLPKQICVDCVEILLTAYNLRDTSNQNDRYLRGCADPETPFVKQEQMEEANFILFEPSVYDDTRSDGSEDERATVSARLNEATSSSCGFTVDCFKNDNKSFVWKYFGTLCDEKGDVLDKDFYYCKFCVQKGELTKYSKHNATTCYLRHLKRLHNIGEDSKKSNDEAKIQKSQPTAIFTCDLCAVRLGSKTAMICHMQRKHTSSGVFPPQTKSDYTVDCYKQGKSLNTSLAWSYFGKLIDFDGVEVKGAQGFNFCKLCVEDGHLLTKFALSNATTALMNHIISKHGISANTKEENSFLSLKKEHNSALLNNPLGYKVNCYKASVSKSFAWNYIGMLVDAKNHPVESESEFVFCKLCLSEGKTDKKFKKSCATTNLLFHLKTVHGVVSDRLEADGSLVSQKAVKREESQEKTCSLCNESFESRKAFFNHLRKVHKTIESSDFVCHVCSKSFTKNYILVKHMRLHSGIDYNCSLCPATFSYPEGLKRHVKIHDPAHLSKYQCDQCTNSYAERKSLKFHILTVHLNRAKERNHQCEFCEMAFVTACNLKRHRMKHTGEKPHECEYCEEVAYTQKGDLIKHLQKAHGTLYNCAHSGCSASFRLQVELREHYRVHFGQSDNIEEAADEQT